MFAANGVYYASKGKSKIKKKLKSHRKNGHNILFGISLWSQSNLIRTDNPLSAFAYQTKKDYNKKKIETFQYYNYTDCMGAYHKARSPANNSGYHTEKFNVFICVVDLKSNLYMNQSNIQSKGERENDVGCFVSQNSLYIYYGDM